LTSSLLGQGAFYGKPFNFSSDPRFKLGDIPIIGVSAKFFLKTERIARMRTKFYRLVAEIY